MFSNSYFIVLYFLLGMKYIVKFANNYLQIHQNRLMLEDGFYYHFVLDVLLPLKDL